MKDPRETMISYWLQTAMPFGSSGGLLGSLGQPVAETWDDPPPTTLQPPVIPADLSGLLSLLSSMPPPSAWNPSSLSLLPTPIGANAGFPAPPTQPAVDWRNDPRLATYAQTPSGPMTPPNLSGLTSLLSSAPPAAPPEHLDSRKYWPAAPALSGASEQPRAHGYYFPPAPQAPRWDQVPTDASTTDLSQIFSQPPGPTSWATPGSSVNADQYSGADEAALAQQAYDASAKRIQRGVRGRATAPDEPPARDPAADAGEPGLIERTRLNGVDSFYRGTVMGAGRLALMQHYASTLDEPGIDPQTKRWRDQLRKEYPGVLADLARYDRMRRFENPLEFGAAALGQLGGGLPTPESAIGVAAKGATWLGRAVRAGLQQGAVNAATDPVVQGLNMRAGVQEEYDPWRTAIAGGLGIGVGGGVNSAAGAWSRRGPRTTAYAAHEAIPGEVGHQLPGPQAWPDTPKSLAAKSAGLYEPPAKPPRPFSDDYPSGALADASGRLIADIEGRPLGAEYIAGRRVAGGADEALTPAEINAMVKEAIGRGPRYKSDLQMNGDSGRYIVTYDAQDNPVRRKMWINRELIPKQKKLTVGHETGHMVEELGAGEKGMSIEGLERELEGVYSTLNTGTERASRHTLPRHHGYSDEEAPYELMAEALRAYMSSPNYFKTVAPNAAAAIRAFVNSHPQLSKLIQFNSLGGLVVGGRAIGGTPGDEPGL
jgi:hypothetical protein